MAMAGLILSTAFMMWKGCASFWSSSKVFDSPNQADNALSRLSVISDSPSPIVVVLSGSMEPAFQRGDLLFLCTTSFLRPNRSHSTDFLLADKTLW